MDVRMTIKKHLGTVDVYECDNDGGYSLMKETYSGIIESSYGKYYITNGKLDRDDGPAATEIRQVWAKMGKLHNTEGPAIVENDGFGQYFLNGEFMNYGLWKKRVKKYKTNLGGVLYGR